MTFPRFCFWSSPVSHPQWGVFGARCADYFPAGKCEAPPADNLCRVLTYDLTFCLRSSIPQSWPFGRCPDNNRQSTS